MKKRKELDALLLSNMNGKKLGKGGGGGSAKEGHELLRNEASWDSNSTENDEFFAPPRRLSIRKPTRWRLCATGAQLCMFVVMVACIVVTGGLVWMHLDLKQDLDELRLRIAKVESELETSSEQASTVSALQQRIEQLQTLPVQITSINRQIVFLNLTSSQLQAKVKAVRDEIKALPMSSVEGLQQTTAQLGSTVQGIQGLQGQQTEQIASLTTSLTEVQTSLTGLQGDVSKLQQAAAGSTPAPGSSQPTDAPPNSPNLKDVRQDVQSLQRGQEGISRDVANLNATLASVQHWRQSLEAAAGHDSSSSSSSSAGNSSSTGTSISGLSQRLTQLQAQVDSLMGSTQDQPQAKESGDQTPHPTLSTIPADWRQDTESQIQALQRRIDTLNPKDLNNNLLNENTTRGIQHQIEGALNVFRTENLKSVDDQWAKLNQQQGDIVDLQHDMAELQARVLNLESGRHVRDSSTVEPETTADLQPITIQGITTAEELDAKFFIMDENNDSFLTYNELKDFLGPGAPPHDQLLEYDLDGDGKWNLSEMTTALGLGFH